MPLRWEILHAEKIVHIVAEGVVTREELEEYFDAIVVANAMPYQAVRCDPRRAGLHR